MTNSSGLHVIDVAAAVLQIDSPTRTLAVRKARGDNAGLWEFPGGKREEQESLSECLHRELAEELGIDARIGPYVGLSEYPSAAGLIRLHAYLVTEWTSKITLKEHDASVWLHCDQLLYLNWSPADIPLVKQLMQQMSDVAGR